MFPAEKPESVVARMELRYYPTWMDQVTVELRVSLDDTFHVTYREEWNGRAWMCRWDGHDNPHNSRDQFHRPPDAATDDAVDRDYPPDLIRTLELVFEFVDDRLGAVWERDRRPG